MIKNLLFEELEEEEEKDGTECLARKEERIL